MLSPSALPEGVWHVSLGAWLESVWYVFPARDPTTFAGAWLEDVWYVVFGGWPKA